MLRVTFYVRPRYDLNFDCTQRIESFATTEEAEAAIEKHCSHSDYDACYGAFYTDEEPEASRYCEMLGFAETAGGGEEFND